MNKKSPSLELILSGGDFNACRNHLLGLKLRLKKLLVVLIIVRDDIQVFCNFYKPVFDFFTQC